MPLIYSLGEVKLDYKLILYLDKTVVLLELLGAIIKGIPVSSCI